MKLMEKETENFILSWNNTLEFNTEDEKQLKQHKFNVAIGSLRKANKKFTGAIILSFVATLFSLLEGLNEAFFCVIMLFWAPFLIASTMEKKPYSESDIEKFYPIPLIEEKIEFRNLFANAVWSIALSLVVAMSIYYLGKGEGYEPPF